LRHVIGGQVAVKNGFKIILESTRNLYPTDRSLSRSRCFWGGDRPAAGVNQRAQHPVSGRV